MRVRECASCFSVGLLLVVRFSLLARCSLSFQSPGALLTVLSVSWRAAHCPFSLLARCSLSFQSPGALLTVLSVYWRAAHCPFSLLARCSLSFQSPGALLTVLSVYWRAAHCPFSLLARCSLSFQSTGALLTVLLCVHLRFLLFFCSPPPLYMSVVDRKVGRLINEGDASPLERWEGGGVGWGGGEAGERVKIDL